MKNHGTAQEGKKKGLTGKIPVSPFRADGESRTPTDKSSTTPSKWRVYHFTTSAKSLWDCKYTQEYLISKKWRRFLGKKNAERF